MKRWIIGIVVVAAAAASFFGYRAWTAGKNGESRYRTAVVERGDVIQTVRATGTIQPIKLVQVGTQVNGPIQKLYVDFNSQVKSGDLVAQIDPTTYQARLAQSQANLLQSQANVEQTQAKLTQAEKELARTKTLATREMLSQSELDSAQATRDTLVAQLKVAQAAVSQAQASLQQATADLGYTTIRSPVDGVVINRAVSEGQTVVASFNAQVLFTIATDLKTIQVEASIPEADIGSIEVNQRVTFTVDAYEEAFTGTVKQVRMAASTVQNVVTYPVIVEAVNPDLKLFPGMTADITCEVAHRSNTLKIPNAALRFKPETAPTDDGGAASKGNGGTHHGGQPGHKVWTQTTETGELKPVRIVLGITDGAFTEVKNSPTLTEGQLVVTGIQASTSKDNTVNPFAPQMPRSARRATR